MAKRHECIDRVEITLHLPEIGLERPEGEENSARHAELGLSALEDRIELGALGEARLQAVLADEGFGEIEERLLEYRLRAIGLQHTRVLPHIGEKGVDRCGIAAGRNSLVLHGADERPEIAAAGRGPGRSRKAEREEGDQQAHQQTPPVNAATLAAGRAVATVR